MAKPKKYKISVMLYLTPEQKAEVERIALKRDMSQQKTIRMMLDLGIDCHKDMEKIGVVAAVDFAYYVREAVRAKLAKSGKK